MKNRLRALNLVLIMMFSMVGCNASPTVPEIAFLSESCLKPYKAYQYSLCDTIRFTVEGSEYFIPTNFHTDLASIPRIVWPILSPAHSSVIRAAIVHDWFYRMTCDFNRKEADLIFYYILRQDGVGNVAASAMYYAVRMFGGTYFNEDYCE